jgi:hypothetical protein
MWGSGESSTQVRRFLVTSWKGVKRADGVERRVNGMRDWTIPLPHENAVTLAASKPGRAAMELYRAVLHEQGLSGPLVTEARQKTVTYDPNSSTPAMAWWSPDGAMGRAQGLPAADPSKLADPSRYQSTFVSAFPARGSLSSAPPSRRTVRSSVLEPITAPSASPDVQRARRVNAILTLAQIPAFVALGLLIATLNRSGYASPGVPCGAVFGHARGPTAACDAWRHHRIVLCVWWAVGIAIAVAALSVAQVRTLRTLRRAPKPGITPGHGVVHDSI